VRWIGKGRFGIYENMRIEIVRSGYYLRGYDDKEDENMIVRNSKCPRG